MRTASELPPAQGRDDGTAETNTSRAIDLARTAEEQFRARDHEWIAQLAQRWHEHHGRGLRLRFETGASLNARFGPPTERQKRGENVLELVAKETKVDESDLGRMRWFAHRFEDYAAFEAACPKITTWSQVRVLLVEMAKKENAAQDSAQAPASSEVKAEAEFRKVKQGLKVLVGLLEKPLRLDDDAQDELQFRLRQLSRAMKKALGVELTISDNTEMVTN